MYLAVTSVKRKYGENIDIMYTAETKIGCLREYILRIFYGSVGTSDKGLTATPEYRMIVKVAVALYGNIVIRPSVSYLIHVSVVRVTNNAVSELFYISNKLTKLFFTAKILFNREALRPSAVMSLDIPAYKTYFRLFNTCVFELSAEVINIFKSHCNVHIRLVEYCLMCIGGGSRLPRKTDSDFN